MIQGQNIKTLGMILILIGGFTSFLSLTVTGGANIYVKDAETNAPIQGAVASITGFSYMGVDYPMTTVLKATDASGKTSFTSSLDTLYYISVVAEGYVTQTGSVSVPYDFQQNYTFNLNKGSSGAVEPDSGSPIEPDAPTELSIIDMAMQNWMLVIGSFLFIAGHIVERREEQ